MKSGRALYSPVVKSCVDTTPDASFLDRTDGREQSEVDKEMVGAAGQQDSRVILRVINN